jgi:hypothetical protein
VDVLNITIDVMARVLICSMSVLPFVLRLGAPFAHTQD